MPLLLLLFISAVLAAQTRAVFYMTPTPGSIRSFLSNAEKIDILIPTFYSTDEQGVVTGPSDSQVLEAARQSRVPVMPIVANPGFRQEAVHSLLINPAARARFSRSLLEECRKHNYYGIQLDLENIPASDRDDLTALVKDTAVLLAGEGFRFSIAAMYPMPDSVLPPGSYSQWLQANWLGAYDLPEIARHVEFISVMTYDQHTERTPPGPVAGFRWVEQVLEHCRKTVPADKLSLGIPLYGRRWYAGTLGGQGAPLTATVNASEAVELASSMKLSPQWDALERAPWFWFYRHGVREYVFYNDAKSFRERYQLAREARLHSFSAWVLGAEDEQIWAELSAARR